MNDTTKSRLLTWIMWFIPILLIGFPFVVLWSVVQLYLCTKESAYLKLSKEIEEEKTKKEKLQIENNINDKKDFANKNNINYVIIGNEIIYTGKNKKCRRN